MDPSAKGLSQGPVTLPPGFDPTIHQPFDRNTAIAVLRRADELLEENEPEQALALYGRVVGAPDRDVQAAAMYGSGNVLYRLDREPEALGAWQRATSVGETPATYRAWRQVAAALVRQNDLRGAVDAYRQSERRAPREDRAEIASRLGWLSKETGNSGAAGRYFASSRGEPLAPFVTYLIIGLTVITSFAAMNGMTTDLFGVIHYSPLLLQLEMNKVLIAHGELYRLLSVTLVHDPVNLLHLLFNMYALYYAGMLVERLYGPWLMLGFYVLCGIAGSTATFVFGEANYGVGASGAVFGLFGVVLVATRVHRAMLDRQWSAIAGQIGVLIVINLVIGFSGALNVDNFAHLGGLAAGLWLGLLIPPVQAPTLSSMWQQQRPVGRSRAQTLVIQVAGIALLLGVIGAGVVSGTDKWGKFPVSAVQGHAPGQSEGPADAVEPLILT
jgi:membrane associated rhomboid family serine protease